MTPADATNRSWKNWLPDQLRKARGSISQAKLAAASGVSDRTIGLIEAGLIPGAPKSTTVARLAQATGNDPGDWLSKLGLTVSPAELQLILESVRVLGQQESVNSLSSVRDRLMTDITEKIETALTGVVPADQLRKRLMSELRTEIRGLHPPRSLNSELQNHVRAELERVLGQYQPATLIRSDFQKSLQDASEGVSRKFNKLAGQVQMLHDRLAQIESVLAAGKRRSRTHIASKSTTATAGDRNSKKRNNK